MNSIALTIIIPCAVIAILLFLAFVIHQELLFGRMIQQNEKVMIQSSERSSALVNQNNILLMHADERLESANKMVSTLAHSADLLSASISELKDMMVHLEQVYTSRNEQVIKNRDEIYTAYNKLLSQYVNLQQKYDTHMEDANRTLLELARRPTSVNNNNIGD